MRFSWMVEAIPALMHISLFLFFSGFLIYLFNINHIAFYVIAGWIAAFAVAYLAITFMPILRLDSPYHAPLSPLAFWVYAAVSYSIFVVLPRLVPLKDMTWQYFRDLADKYFAGCSQGIEKMAEVHARKPSPGIDGFILKWTFDANSMASDNQLDQFFECLLAFNSPDPRRSLAKLSFGEFGSAMVAFLDRTLTSSSVPNSVKVEQLIKCVEVADVTYVTILLDLLSEAAVQNVVQDVEVGRTLRRRNSNDEQIGLCAQTIVADIIAKVPRRDDIWITLAADQLGKSQDDIRGYLKHGNDNVLLANLIHITRQIFKSSSGITRDMAGNAASYILRLPSEFDIRNTLPVLQHDFCALWNDIVPTAQQRGDSSIPHFVLYLLRRHFIDLHRGTDDSPTSCFDDFKISSYPSCNNPHHRPAETAGTTLATWNHAHTDSRSRNPFSPNRVSGTQTATVSPVSPENNIIPLRSRHVNDATAPHNVTTSTSHSLSVAVMPVPSTPLIGDLPSADSFMNESDHHSRGASSSSPIAAFLPIDPQVAPSDPGAITAIATSRVHEDTHDRNVSSQLGLPRYALQSELSTPNVVVTTIPGHAFRDPSEGPS
jgi:hypothetical protein